MAERETTWRVAGMYCPNCEQRIRKTLGNTDGITVRSVSYQSGTLNALWDAELLPEQQLRAMLSEEGYQLKGRESRLTKLLNLAGLLLSLTGLFLLFTHTPIKAILSHFPTAEAGMSGLALFTLGLLTSLHCVGMCGGINLAQSSASAQAGKGVTGANLQYNLGRVLSYTVIGGLAGALGSILTVRTGLQAMIQLLAALMMLLMGLNLLDFSFLRGALPRLPEGLRQKLLGKGNRSSFWIGLANGLMPCGPLQAMQLYALATESFWRGALVMLLFSLGTVPLMLGFGLLSGGLNKRYAKPMRLTSGAIVLVMAVSMLTNSLSLAGVNFQTGKTAVQSAAVADGVQQITSELDWRGYPDITVEAGKPVRWVISAEANKITGCNNEIVIPALNLRIPLKAGENIIEFQADEPGVIPYTCWMGMLHGTITVVEPTVAAGQ